MNETDGFDDFEGYTGQDRYIFIRDYAKHLGNKKTKFSLEDLQLIMKGMANYRMNTLGVLESNKLLPQVFDKETLSFLMNETDGFDDFEGYTGQDRYIFIRDYAKHLGNKKTKFSLEGLQLIMKGMANYRMNTLGVLESNKLLPQVFDKETLNFLMNETDGFDDFEGYKGQDRYTFIRDYANHFPTPLPKVIYKVIMEGASGYAKTVIKAILSHKK